MHPPPRAQRPLGSTRSTPRATCARIACVIAGVDTGAPKFGAPPTSRLGGPRFPNGKRGPTGGDSSSATSRSSFLGNPSPRPAPSFSHPVLEALGCRRRLFKDTPTSSDQSLHHVAHPDVVLLDHRTLKIEGLLDLIDLAPSPLTHLDRRNRLPETVAQPQPWFADP